jgi:ribosomal-protein-alanine N-acetyltransferase
MPDDLAIAPATNEDLDAIHAIEKASFPTPWCREFFAEEMRLEGRRNFVARRDGAIVGYLFTMWLFDEMHVNKIAVAPVARRSGVADALMAHVIELGRRDGIASVSLEVRQSNEGAIAFYTHLGFEKTYVRKRYYPDGESAVVMTLRLS